MKYKFWDVSRDRKKKPITLSDRILELVALAMAVVMLILTGVLYSKAPDMVPIHFNITGVTDGWGGKSFYWILAGVMLFGMAICASAAYNRKLVNLPIRLKEPVFYRQIGLISRMCRIMTIVLGFIWLTVLLAMSASFIGMPEDVSVALILLSVILMLGVVLFYTLKIWWIGRNSEMKKLLLLGVVFALSACSQVEKGELIQIDLEKGYPSKEFVLQDLWQVKYVPMETDSMYLLGGGQPWYASDNLLGFVDNRTGSLLFFDAKTGAKAFHINRKGGGPGEYVSAGAIVVDEAKGEVFVWSIFGGAFLVYDKNGKYLRSLPLRNYKKGEFADVSCAVDFDESSLLCSSNDLKGYALHYFLNKQTGETTLLDSIGKEKYVSPFLMKQSDEGVMSVAPKVVPVVKSGDGFIYADHSSDTIFKMREDASMQPWVVRRSSVKSTDPIKLLRYNDEAEDWIFLSSVEMSFDFEAGKGLPEKCYAVHKQTHEIVEATFVNQDYAGTSPGLSFDGCTCLGADKLVDALDEGRLSGELKALAEKLDIEDNPVVMIRTRK